MATLKSRLDAFELKSPEGATNYCIVIHGDGDCATHREQAIAKFAAVHGSAPVKFINVIFVHPDGTRGTCLCKEVDIGEPVK